MIIRDYDEAIFKSFHLGQDNCLASHLYDMEPIQCYFFFEILVDVS